MLNLNPDDFLLKPALATIHCEPDWKWKKRDHPMPNYDLFYVWSGEGTVVLNKKSYKVGKGHCFLFCPGDDTEAIHNPQNPFVLTYIHFDLVNEPRLIPGSHRILADPISFESLLSRYVRLFLVKTYGAEIEGKLILKQLMIHLLREEHCESQDEQDISSRRLAETIREIANYIQQHPGEPHTVESLAERAHLSERYFSQKFKQIIGHTVKSYVVHCRIKRAEHLLHFTGLTVTEAAHALGYRDLHYFSRQFKQYTGRNPSEIR
ncbi:AraC-type DNA-binding protein [Bhargavaea ginsengi]|uniref:AraC-type DNA-binding protein n=1 Tax=Bhargavaea ginsengi TaxID=426757 RepID=A0A1H6XSL4_9BACL|nr:AraC family transcriptional regulator [Bhargavaea ginsengi]SEJ29737.1 AraC-type DNA-binding protein [Bhargavaea ginsengi]